MIGRLSVLLFFPFLLAASADAQTVSLTSPNPRRWDASVTVGWLGGDKEGVARRWNDWYDTFATSIDFGRYWTSHLKIEAGATFTTEGDVYSEQMLSIPGEPSPIFFSREHRFAIRAASLGGAYQFFENTWVHPFLGAGLQLAWERERIQTPFSPVSGRGGRPLPIPNPTVVGDTRFDPLPFVTGGAKLYVHERGFIRTDLSAAFDARGAARVWWRVGGGVDF